MLVGKDWLEHHLETFVRPYLGKVPNVTQTNHVKYMDTPHLLALGQVWKAAKEKSEGRRFLLAGRDVWEVEILARLEGFPTIFRPDISSVTKDYIKEDYSDCYLLDTGNRGTIPTRLGIRNFDLLYSSIVDSTGRNPSHLVIPHRNNGAVYDLYSILEGSPKYWTQARMDDAKKKIVQELNPTKEFFESAAILTQHIARHFIPRRLL